MKNIDQASHFDIVVRSFFFVFWVLILEEKDGEDALCEKEDSFVFFHSQWRSSKFFWSI